MQLLSRPNNSSSWWRFHVHLKNNVYSAILNVSRNVKCLRLYLPPKACHRFMNASRRQEILWEKNFILLFRASVVISPYTSFLNLYSHGVTWKVTYPGVYYRRETLSIQNLNFLWTIACMPFVPKGDTTSIFLI